MRSNEAYFWAIQMLKLGHSSMGKVTLSAKTKENVLIQLSELGASLFCKKNL